MVKLRPRATRLPAAAALGGPLPARLRAPSRGAAGFRDQALCSIAPPRQAAAGLSVRGRFLALPWDGCLGFEALPVADREHVARAAILAVPAY